jgi:hypothetical protein
MLLLVKSYTPTSSLSGALVQNVMKLASITLLKFGFLLLVQFNLGFTTEGRLSTVLIIPSLGVPNELYLQAITQPSSRRAWSIARALVTLFWKVSTMASRTLAHASSGPPQDLRQGRRRSPGRARLGGGHLPLGAGLEGCPLC